MAATGSMSVARLASCLGNTTDVRRSRSAVRSARSAATTVRCGAMGDQNARNARAEEMTLDTSSTRRQILLATAATFSLAQMDAFPQAIAADDVASFKEPLLAYEFSYPTKDANGNPIKWFAPRPAERYSSAAPMSADARQRIVYELLNIDGSTPLTLSVAVGPIPPKLLDIPSDEWKPEQVAEAILEEKSTGRVTSGQRVAMSSLEEATLVERNGTKYWLYEHVAQGSPNASEVYSKETYRHSLAVTALRGDYLYTLNVAAPEKRWDSVAAGFVDVQQSFTLNDPANGYVPPEKDPWRFW
eukprot:CAMPEP_0118952772 /NCGR_PEP_ID=MMETSP1169-20130426/55419_1 /TAXON_ID=36882 /ORGANISM="Pyramimonas obovata, Strain CCMP722" /LENGTH=300 /DNA_ID=CAMNT_0006900099 /DNA_START=70 /DNA_END=972 /DNA_ORIENTATION=-